MQIDSLVHSFLDRFDIREFLRLLVLAHVQVLDLLVKIADLSLEGEQFVIAEDSKRLLGYVLAGSLGVIIVVFAIRSTFARCSPVALLSLRARFCFLHRYDLFKPALHFPKLLRIYL